MQNLICRLKNEISNLDSDTNVHSFYKYTLHPKYLNLTGSLYGVLTSKSIELKTVENSLFLFKGTK